MFGYNILCALSAIVGTLLWCGCGDIFVFSTAAIVMFLFFYSLFTIGFFPSYWAFVRNLKERVGIIIANATTITTMFAFANVISSILDNSSRVTMAGSAIGASIIMNMIMPLVLIVGVLWLGLFIFKVVLKRGQTSQGSLRIK